MCDSGWPVGIRSTIFWRARIDHGDRARELGGDVEATVGPEQGAVRTLGPTEVDGGHAAARRDVDDVHGPAVRAGLAHARIAVDGHVGGAAVGRGDHLVAR